MEKKCNSCGRGDAQKKCVACFRFDISREVRYCDEQCQHDDWSHHKIVCASKRTTRGQRPKPKEVWKIVYTCHGHLLSFLVLESAVHDDIKNAMQKYHERCVLGDARALYHRGGQNIEKQKRTVDPASNVTEDTVPDYYLSNFAKVNRKRDIAAFFLFNDSENGKHLPPEAKEDRIMNLLEAKREEEAGSAAYVVKAVMRMYLTS